MAAFSPAAPGTRQRLPVRDTRQGSRSFLKNNQISADAGGIEMIAKPLLAASVVSALLLLVIAMPTQAQTAWTLTWSDEFSGPAGSAPDPAKWTYDTGGGGWGNNELEYYTNSRNNSYIDGNGNLVIKALKQRIKGNAYTSARLKTQGLFAQAYGRFEARIKVPFGQGIWPAFWLLGNDIGTVGWPTCGETDIMENIGREPSIVHGSLHGPGYDFSAPFSLTGGQAFKDDYHIYAVEWSTTQVRWYVDGIQYASYDATSVPSGQKWVFDHPFFIIFNVAVGGNWPGNPDKTTVFPQSMLVDYIRVYQAN
jgi:beta-glucanase (GH16 family)